MKVLVVCSSNNGKISPFIVDQVEALNKLNVKTDYFFIEGKGITGYLRAFSKMIKKIKSFKPDIVHAHYGLSGLLSALQRIKPVVITFHGCDVNVPSNRRLSKLASRLSCKSIYVSEDLAVLNNQKNPVVIPCGVDLDIFYPMDKISVRNKLKLSLNKKYILFSSSFDNKVKNYELANEAVLSLNDFNIELLELKGYTREEVSVLMNAVDMVLLTSLREGSPQFIKEALSCNTPIVSVDVGDISDLVDKVEGSLVVDADVTAVANGIKKILSYEGKTDGRTKMLDYNNEVIAKKVINVYKSCL